MEQFINQIIKKTKKIYSDDYSYMLSDYNQELETAKGYNGRQLLELLQNCDDQACKKVCIDLNEEKGTITVNNDGIPFSENGYRSLFIPYLSSKTSQIKYIGNKGLGFRSIITWSKAIEIQSNNLSLIYSEENRRKNFDSLYSNEQKQIIREKENIKDSIVPIPFLTLPQINSVAQNEFVTSIIIKYKDKYLEDIKKQLDAITPETILFLKHIEEIVFKGVNGKDRIGCTRIDININKEKFCPHTRIDFDNSSWLIFEKEESLPTELSDTSKKEAENYQIKIAVEKDFKLTSPYLYSFFPTKIRLEQPYILHATFDLDLTRNQINDSEKNRFILNRIIEFTIAIAMFYTEGKVSYRPLEILHHEHKADSLISLGYYDLIESVIETEALFPCIDNTYRTKAQCIYASDSFAQMLKDIGGEQYINIHLIPRGAYSQEFVDNFKVNKDLSLIKNVSNILNKISNLTLSEKQRARFIFEIIQFADFIKDTFRNKLALLTNNNGDLIKGSEYIYTPITKDNKLKTPSFTNIQFINKQLFSELVTIFDFNSADSKDRSRFIAEKLEGFCNIHSYEPATLARKIVSETNRVISEDKKNAIVMIQEMNECLFHNFQLLEDSTKLPPTVSVPLLSQGGKVINSSNLVLSEEYPTGKYTNLLFKDVYSKNDYVGSPTELGLPRFQDDAIEYERYLIWLGINKYAKYSYREGIVSGLESYVRYVLGKYNSHNFWTSYSINYNYINGFEDILKRISIECLIGWIYLDSELRSSIDDSENQDSFSYFYYSKKWIHEKPSFLKYTILHNYDFDFKNYLIDDKYSWVNTQVINYNYELFRKLNITKTEINEILIKLGASDDFLNLSIDRIAQILNLLPKKYPSGSKSQTVYKKALSHYALNKKVLENEVLLFANNGTEIKLYPQEKVFFSDRIKLPKRLYKDFPIFNFPSRSGGSEAIKFFGINDLNEIQISITKSEVHEKLSSSFSKYLEELKPFILAHRINDIDESRQQKSSASICNQLKIILSTHLIYKVNDQIYELSDYEYIHKEAYTYFIKIKEYDSLTSLKRNVVFTQSFADIISISFNVIGERNEFKYMLKSDIEDVKLSVIEEFGNDNYNEARNLLGLADNKQAFWEAVFTSIGLKHDHNLDDFALEDKIKNELDIEFDVTELDYDNLNRHDELIKIQTLFLSLNLKISDFNEHFISEFSLSDIHFENLKNEIIKLKPELKIALWYDLKDKSVSEQKKYLDLIDKMEHYHEFAEAQSIEHRYDFEIDGSKIAKIYIYELYGKLEFGKNVDLVEIRKKNSNTFTFEEMELINSSTELKSILYFKKSLSELKIRLEKSMAEENFDNTNSDTENELVLIDDRGLVPSNDQTSKKKRKKSVYTPSHNDEKKKKLKGDTLERLVYNYMIKNQFKNVDWVSRDNEGLHCDIRYTGEDGKVKYVEVKAFDNNSFFLTKEEYQFGKSEKANYEIWLVREFRKIYQLKDFFQNPMYKASIEANEFIVHLRDDKSICSL